MDMNTVNVATLKSSLSQYLHAVEKGEEVIVTSHRRPVARIVQYKGAHDLAVIPAKKPAKTIKLVKGVKLRKPCDPVALLREDRDSR